MYMSTCSTPTSPAAGEADAEGNHGHQRLHDEGEQRADDEGQQDGTGRDVQASAEPRLLGQGARPDSLMSTRPKRRAATPNSIAPASR